MDNMIVSVWSAMLKELTPIQAIDKYVELGFKGFELSRDHLENIMETANPINTAREISDYARDKNFLIPQVHLPMLDVVLSKNADRYLDEQRRRIEVILSMGQMENIVIHLGKGMQPAPEVLSYEYILSRRVRAIDKLKDLVEGTNSYLCIENLVANCRTSGEILDVLREVDCKNVAVCYDTGHQHENHKLESALHFVESLGSNIKAIHFDDNDGIHEQHLPPYSLGLNLPEYGAERLNVDEVLFGLKSIGFKGLFNFELPGEYLCPIEVKCLKLKYLKALGEYMVCRMNGM